MGNTPAPTMFPNLASRATEPSERSRIQRDSVALALWQFPAVG
jgi:hypothetical protein